MSLAFFPRMKKRASATDVLICCYDCGIDNQTSLKRFSIESIDMIFRTLFSAALISSALPSYAADSVHYCAEEKVAGMGMVDGAFVPYWSENEGGRRYTIHFNEDHTELTGVQGGETLYRCIKGFPTKAPDVITCTNSKMITATYSYSTKSGHFTHVITHPGGWLSMGTEREPDEPKSDVFVFGKCQAF